VILVFWVAVGLILYTYAGYPVVIWGLAKLRDRQWHKADITPSVSIVMAVHNGAALLERKFEHLLKHDYPNLLEIIAVSDGSTDETNEILRRQDHPKCKSIILKEQCGKAVALNAGIAEAKGEIILFVDVRPWLGDDSLRTLVRSFADPQVGCVAGELVLHHEGHDAGAAAVGGLYWVYEQWLRDTEARFDSPLGVYGGYYAVRRELAEPFPAGTILDDMYEPLSIIRKGYRSVLDPEAKVYDTWPKSAADEFKRKVRTLAGNFQLVQLAPWLLLPTNRVWFQFVCHKIMRLLVPMFLALAFISSAAAAMHSKLFFALLLLQVGFYLAAIFGSKIEVGAIRKLSGVAEAFCMLNVAVVVAFYKYLFAERPLWRSLWSKPHVGVHTEQTIGASVGR
jgi:cellulose synthase/poly-beta-1,6-N-acetylglucosamine synthase-like glycosyltransferase